MLKNPKKKGTRLELIIRNILNEFGYKMQRTPMSGAIAWMKGDLIGNFPFFLEVKNVETSHFLKWYKKAKLECGPKPPMIVWSKNREDIYCFLKFSDLLSILQGKPVQPIEKIKKTKKISVEESKSLPFSKYNQLHGKMPRK